MSIHTTPSLLSEAKLKFSPGVDSVGILAADANVSLKNKTVLDKRIRLAALLALSSLATACQSLPYQHDPTASTKTRAAGIMAEITEEHERKNGHNERTIEHTIASQWELTTANTTFANTGWLAQLDDERLLQHIQTALNNNPNLAASAANLQASIQAAKVTGASLWPQLEANLNRTRTQNENPDGEQQTPIYSTTYSGSYNISWEVDIWGRLNAQRRSAVFDAESQRANYAAAKLALVANVAQAWFNLNTIKLRLDIAQRRLDSQQNTLTVIEDNYKSGLNSALEVYLNRTDLATQQSSIIEIQDQLNQANRTFLQLLGEYPVSTVDFTARLPDIGESVPAGLPSELLARRPDVLASLRQWQASKLNAKAAKRARLPSFSLTASYGASSKQLRFLDQKQLLWNLVNNLSLPLFQGGRLIAQARQAEFLADANFQNYLSTLLTSFAEVENALSAEQLLKQRVTATQDASYYSESGYNLALEQYQRGLINYTTLLESQRRWFDAQSNLVNLQNTLLQNRIALYLALGGDFTSQRNHINNNNDSHTESTTPEINTDTQTIGNTTEK